MFASDPTKMARKHTGTRPAESINLTTAQLRERPDLCAVDGVLYNLKGFSAVHPGGAQIQGAGAYDASALYHSMHPQRHDPTKSEVFQKYRVGVHQRAINKAGAGEGDDVVYTFDSPFAKDLLDTVRKTLAQNGIRSWYAPLGFYARVALIAAATLYCEYMWITTGEWAWAIAVGVTHAQIGLSIQHDASHGAVSGDARVNDILTYGADWVGNSRWIWFQQHVLWHHPHTNNHGLDPDATSAEPLVLFHPPAADASEARKWFHAFQHYFIHLVLSLYGPAVIYNPSPVLTMQHNENIPKSLASGTFMERQKRTAWLMRMFYVVRIVLWPTLRSGAHLLVALLLPSVVTGMLLTFVFVVSHNFVGSDREPTPKADPTAGPVCWYKAQAETSCSYGGVGGMMATGGLNLQIEHHLFPRLSSWHYPTVRPAVQKCCERHGVKYAYFPYLHQNVGSMLAYVREVGAPDAAHLHAH